MKSLNGSKSHTYCVYLNEFRGDPSSLNCSVNGSTKPEKFLFAVNVGRSSEGDTFIGSNLQRGCHWTMCLVDINSREIIYGDSLGWPIPHGLIEKVYLFIRFACSAEKDEFSVVLCHAPHSMNSRTGAHECNSACAQLYPFQTCSSICGIVVMVMAAIACHNLPLFKLMATTCSSQGNTNQSPHIYLQKPSQFNGYLRRVIASWVAENAVSIDYVVPQSVQLPLQSLKTPNFVNDQEKPDDEVSDESNEEAHVKVSGIEDNSSTFVNNDHCQLNMAKGIQSSGLADKDRGHQIPANQDSDSNKQDSDVPLHEKKSDDSINSSEPREENCSVPAG